METKVREKKRERIDRNREYRNTGRGEYCIIGRLKDEFTNVSKDIKKIQMFFQMRKDGIIPDKNEVLSANTKKLKFKTAEEANKSLDIGTRNKGNMITYKAPKIIDKRKGVIKSWDTYVDIRTLLQAIDDKEKIVSMERIGRRRIIDGEMVRDLYNRDILIIFEGKELPKKIGL